MNLGISPSHEAAVHLPIDREREGVGFIASLGPTERLRYYDWWRKYLLLKYLSRSALVICIAFLVIPLVNLSLRWVALAVKPAFLAAIVTGLWWSFLECPRCGERYRWGGELDYFGDDCQNCGLTSAELSSIARPK